MPRMGPDFVPTYRKHKATGQAVVTISGRDIYPGRYGTAASKREYERVLGEWFASGRQLPAHQTASDLTVAELISRYWPWVKSYYRHADGTETKEVDGFLRALRPLNHLHRGTPTKDFGPIALKAIRDLMLKGYDHPKYGHQTALSRGVINQRVKRIRRMFRWAVEQELVSATVLQTLEAVQGLKCGRSEARETEPVQPVSRAVVQDTLPLLRPMQAAMVRLQLETGMRPGELVTMCACDLDTTSSVWLYKVPQHKTFPHGHVRLVPIGPKGQEIIRRHMLADTQTPIFSPARNMEERRLALR